MIPYPKTMHHPHFRKGTATLVEGQDPVSGRKYRDYQGTPDRLPPLFVENSDQEDHARARGYLDPGEAAPAAALGGEYPLVLVHPDHADAIPDDKMPQKIGDGPVTFVTIPGKPERYPHVTVQDAAQEAAWQAKGYDRPGVCDPTAVEAARANPRGVTGTGAEWPKMVNGVLMEDPNARPDLKQYPMWVTTGKDPNTGDPIGKAVADLAEHIALCKRLGMPEPGQAAQAAPPAPPAPPALSAPVAIVQSDFVPILTKGDKIRATKARKKAERLAEQQAATAA